MDVSFLTQASPIIISSGTDTSSKDNNTWDSEEDPSHELEDSDLSDYFQDRADLNAPIDKPKLYLLKPRVNYVN